MAKIRILINHHLEKHTNPKNRSKERRCDYESQFLHSLVKVHRRHPPVGTKSLADFYLHGYHSDQFSIRHKRRTFGWDLMSSVSDVMVLKGILPRAPQFSFHPLVIPAVFNQVITPHLCIISQSVCARLLSREIVTVLPD